MRDLINWLIPWMLGYLFNDFYSWLKGKRGWHECPVSTCNFKMKLNDDRVKWQTIMMDHVVRTHNQHYN